MAARKRRAGLKGSTFGQRLRSARIASGVSVTDIVDKIGVCKSAYYQYETGDKNPPADRLSSIAEAVKTTVGALYGEAA